MMVGFAGSAYTITLAGSEVGDKQLLISLTATVKSPDAVKVIERVVSLELQMYLTLGVDVKVTLPPLQNAKGLPDVITGFAGKANTVILVVSDGLETQPLVSITCTAYLPTALIFLMVGVVAPVFHKYLNPKLEVKESVSPWQIAAPLFEGVIVGLAGTRKVLNTTGAESLDLQVKVLLKPVANT